MDDLFGTHKADESPWAARPSRFGPEHRGHARRVPRAAGQLVRSSAARWAVSLTLYTVHRPAAYQQRVSEACAGRSA